MTDNAFKRLRRSQLIDIIYEFQLQQEELITENEKLRTALADKRTLANNSGNLAETVLAFHNVMPSEKRDRGR